MKKFNEFSAKDIGDDTFVRWGGANAVRQKKELNIGWHTPPDGRGIYAFPIRGIERFLSAHRMKERYSRIKYRGDLWHHLVDKVKPRDVLQREGSWVLTEFKVWEKAFSKELIEMRLKGWNGKINKDEDETGSLTNYWHHYMGRKFPYVNKEHCRNPDPIIDARWKRYVNKMAPTPEDLADPDFVEVSTNGIPDTYFYSFREWQNDMKGNSKGGHSADHLEVFLPNVS